MKDFFGNELNVGDTVAFEQPRYRNLVLGTIVGFTAHNVRVIYVHQDRQFDYLTPPEHLIKRS